MHCRAEQTDTVGDDCTARAPNRGPGLSFAGASLQIAYAAPVSAPAIFIKEDGWLYARLAYAY
jgi:hypothetical protein